MKRVVVPVSDELSQGDIRGEDKRRLRKWAMGRQFDTCKNVFLSAGERIAEHFQAWFDDENLLFGAARSVAAFASLPSEVDTEPLLKALQSIELHIVLPTIVDGALLFRTLEVSVDDLPLGAFNVRTPPSSSPAFSLVDCACVVVPGLLFDSRGGRLGFGKGYYDKALGVLEAHCQELGRPVPPTIGIGLDEQLVDEVPMQEHDVFLSHVCTPSGGVLKTQFDRK